VQDLLATAEAGPASELQQARADLVRAQLVFMTSRRSDAAPLLLGAAKRLEPIAPDLAWATYLGALVAAIFAGRFAPPGGSLLEVTRAASAARPPERSAGQLLLDGMAANFTEGYAAGLPILRDALRALSDGVPVGEERRWMQLAFIAAVHTWDDDACEAVSDRRATLCRQAGALGDLPLALNARAVMLLLMGDLTAAASLLEEVKAATDATGIDFGSYGAVGLAALRGKEAEAEALIGASVSEASQRRDGSRLAAALWARALLNNGLGRYEHALAAAEHAADSHVEFVYANWALIELIEAAARVGMSEAAAAAHRRLAEMTRASGTEWGLGIEARSRALLSDGEVAEGLYREAIERLGRTRMHVAVARAHLLYGEWLRRERRRLDAREQLRTAHEMFARMGAAAFAGRAERELLATGEHVRKRVVETQEELTAQEAQIARLAREGVSNAEIGERLFISRRTVEYHLSKVFTKLGINSRHELDRVLPPAPTAAVAS
jgi:DNA-binding CsgD family transcriptional regulator